MRLVRLTKKDKDALEAYRRKVELIQRSGVDLPPETVEERERRKAKLLADPIAFAQHYFPHYCTSPCAEFHRQFAWYVQRNRAWTGFCEWPRGHAKSVWCNVIIPLWLWARGEPMYMVIVGNSFDRAKMLLQDSQAEFEANERLTSDYGEQKMLGSWEDGRFITKGGFIGQACGMGQNVRGLKHQHLRPTYIVVDDIETRELVKNERRQREIARWIKMDLMGTFDGPVRRFIKANNKFAVKMVQTILQEEHPEWHVHHIKAWEPGTFKPTWSAKYTAEHWRHVSGPEGMGMMAAQAEYQHEAYVEGTIFKEEQINWGKPPRIDHFKMIVAHWDVAYAGTKNADYNAVRLWGLYDGQYWLLDCYVKQSKMREAVQWMVDVDKRMQEKNITVLWRFESQFWNDEVRRTIYEVCKASRHDLRLTKVDAPKSNKYDRILSMEGYYQNGRIWYSEKLRGHQDTQIGKMQLLGIEPGYNGHDDAPDADEQAIRRLSTEDREEGWFDPVFGSRERSKRVY